MPRAADRRHRGPVGVAFDAMGLKGLVPDVQGVHLHVRKAGHAIGRDRSTTTTRGTGIHDDRTEDYEPEHKTKSNQHALHRGQFIGPNRSPVEDAFALINRRAQRLKIPPPGRKSGRRDARALTGGTPGVEE